MAAVAAGLIRSRPCAIKLTHAASRFPNAPSHVVVAVAASCATSVRPRLRIASLNSSAVISPAAIASRKLPV